MDTPPRRKRVYLVDDETMVRAAFRSLLESECGAEVVGAQGDARQAIKEIPRLRPDLILLDITMPGLSGVDAIPLILEAWPEARIVMLTHQDAERFVIRSLRTGARGYLHKDSDPEELRLAMDTVLSGGRYLSPRVGNGLIEKALSGEGPEPPMGPLDRLTPRERQVLQLLVLGKPNKQVARELGMSLATAKKHRENLQRKLDCHSLADLTRLAIREGLLQS